MDIIIIIIIIIMIGSYNDKVTFVIAQIVQQHL